MSSPETLILASGSATRAKMLRDAGLNIIVEKPRVDEEAVKQSLRAEGLDLRAQADALAEVKALSVSRRMPGFVLGADQMLGLEGQAFDKVSTREEAQEKLRALRGKTHVLMTAAVIAREGAVIARFMDSPRLTMRNFSDAFLEAYLDQIGEDAFRSVGCYQLEGPGAQLFSRIDGDFFSILGLPLIHVLAFLREHQVVPT
jgi:septum formation protein